MLYVFRRDLHRLKELVEAISTRPAPYFFTGAWAALSVSGSGGLALLGYYTPMPRPELSQALFVTYWLMFGAGALITLALTAAGFVFKHEHKSGRRQALREIQRIEYEAVAAPLPSQRDEAKGGGSGSGT